MYYFSNLFDKVLYMFCKCPRSIIRSISTLCTCYRNLSFLFSWRLLAWSLTTLADTNKTIMTNTYCL